MVDVADNLWDIAADIRALQPEQPMPGTLHGAAAIITPDVIWWAPDIRCLAALREAGYPQSVCLVPARGRGIFDALRDNEDMLAAAGKIVICGGGSDFHAELSRRLGRHRAWCLAAPRGCADVADIMQQHGIQAVRDAVDGATPYPISGVYRPDAASMLAHRHAPPPITLTTGCAATDQIMRLPGEGKLVVIAGIPNHGKSTWMTSVMSHTAQQHARRFLVFSPETGSWQHLAAQVMTWRSGKPFRPMRGIPSMTDEEISEGAEWCASRFTFLACDGEQDAPSLDWILDRSAACILRDGVTDILIDPWNELEHDEGGRTETIYLNRALQRLRAFAERHGVNVFIVAHPIKLKPVKPGEQMLPPTAYDIAGSAAWANKGDVIIAIHCPDVETEVHLLKARFRRWGRRGAIAKLQFDPITGRFRSASVPDARHDPAPPNCDAGY